MELKLDHIYSGDVLDNIKKFPDRSVHCIITSPPYFGLRDYKTSFWVGGDEKCKHEGYRRKSATDRVSKHHKQHSNDHTKDITHGDCIKCGAVRTDHQIGLESWQRNDWVWRPIFKRIEIPKKIIK